jgi:hypothetical protein
MTELEDIIDAGFDGTICTEPPIHRGEVRNITSCTRAIIVELNNSDDMVMGIMDQAHYNPDSYDGWICKLCTETSYADALNIIKAIKKVCSTYAATSAENILQWEGGTWKIFNEMRWEFTFVIMVYRAGIASY